jgi:GT2 family glycosyltransferase
MKKISVIIPARSEKDPVAGLLDDIKNQKADLEVEVIRITGVSPVALARNKGAGQAKGEILCFIDSDIRLGDENYLANLARSLEQDKRIGAVCASLRLPSDASLFQKRYVSEIAHYQHPIVEEPVEVFVAASACFAVTRELFLYLNGFDEKIVRGEDSEFSWRLLQAGYRIMLAPRTWCYHPAPDNISELIRINVRNGLGVAFVDTFYPHLNIDVHPETITKFSSPKSKGQRLKRFILSGLKAIVSLKFLLVLSKLFYMAGYVWGLFRYRKKV